MSEPLVDVMGARRRRERARRLRRLKIVGVATAVLAVIGAFVWVIDGSPWLRVAEVRVEGTALTTPEEVRRAAGVEPGQPMVRVDPAAVAVRVGELPAVAFAEVGRSWPSAITIEVIEKTAVLVLDERGRYAWIAADGEAFHFSSERPAGALGARGNVSDQATLAALARVAGDLPVEVRQQASYLSATTADSITVVLRNDRRIVWGSAEEGAIKAAVIVPLLGVKATEYDISAPTHPTTR